MQNSPFPSTSAIIAFVDDTATPVKISNYVTFGFVLEVTAAITTDAVFEVMAHDATADPLVAGPATAIPEVVKCYSSNAAADKSTVTIPAGTTKADVVGFTIPCRSGDFVSLKKVSGDTAKLQGSVVLNGPKY